MMEIKREKFRNFREIVNFPIDVFVCCASFEDRSKAISERIGKSQIRTALVCKNQDFSHVVDDNFDALIDHFGLKAQPVVLDTTAPIMTADNLRHSIEKEVDGGASKFLIDITTFTHEEILVLLKIIPLVVPNGGDVVFCYNPAQSYPGASKDEKGWLSKGIGGIRSVLGYSGLYQPERKSHLIVLVGMESERAEKLIDAYEPSIVSLGKGLQESSISDTLHDVNNFYFKKLKSKYQHLDKFEFSCTNPLDAKDAILNQVRLFPDHNVVVAPMNNKISTAGAALAAMEMQQLQLCYAHANEYNVERYSTPSDEYIAFRLPDLWGV
ncbi:MAG: hypothetical protein BA863_16050 [Desulfovibrio sp. S3730MH75]|nr:MAG: hypothetical protein BA863_16050 [Desulfovibrio sp. S3730MH75]